MNKLRQELFEILKDKSFKLGKVKLASGKTSDYYLDARISTLTAKGALLSALMILELIKNDDINAIGGPTLGADPLVGAIAASSAQKGMPIDTFIVRKEPKKHGMCLNIEGPALNKGDKVVVIDDVATSGGSLIKAIDILRQEGVEVVKAVVLVDREEGAAEALEAKGVKLVSLFSIKEFLSNHS